MTKQEAFDEAAALTKKTGRKHVVGNTGFSTAPTYGVFPLYELGAEGYRTDKGYAEMGALVEESLR